MSANIGFRSDSYTCPFHSSYTDSRKIFETCIGSTANAPSGIDLSAATVPVFGDSLLYNSDGSGTNPIHGLGAVVSGDTVDIKIEFPRPTGKLPSSFTMTLLGSNNQPVNPQPSPFGSNVDISLDSTFLYEDSWTVGTDGTYKIKIERVDTSDL